MCITHSIPWEVLISFMKREGRGFEIQMYLSIEGNLENSRGVVPDRDERVVGREICHAREVLPDPRQLLEKGKWNLPTPRSRRCKSGKIGNCSERDSVRSTGTNQADIICTAWPLASANVRALGGAPPPRETGSCSANSGMWLFKNSRLQPSYTDDWAPERERSRKRAESLGILGWCSCQPLPLFK